jgi:hypothetical protein
MSVVAAWRERAQQHEAAQRKLRAGLREKFPFAAECGDRLRAAGFKDARVVEAFENGVQYMEAIEGVLDSSDVLASLRDDAARKKKHEKK